MIAPTARGCKRADGERVQIRERQIVRNPLCGQGIHRHGIVSGNHNTAQFPPSDRPSGLPQVKPALARSFRFRIPQPPAPRDRRDRACSQDSLSPYWANESWSFFVWTDGSSAARQIRRCRCNDRGPEIISTELSEATCRPHRASGRACRDCRPGHRPPRHRPPRGKYFRAARSSCRSCRSSHLP
jgi:hypothetical protein